jgi:C-terminal processing protease CtpA/Prc
MRTHAKTPLALALAVALPLLSGCPAADGDLTGFGDAFSACTDDLEKAHVLAYTRDWYLYQDLLPATVDPAAYDTADDLLHALTAEARAQDKDRGWSFLVSLTQSQAFNSSGASAGFGMQFIYPDDPPTRVFLADVFEDTAAYEAGFRRGDEILAIGDTADALVATETLLASGTFQAAVGPSTAGVTRTFQVRTAAGEEATRTMTKRSYSLRPVPPYRVLDLPSGGKVGYVALRTFIQPADAQLREAFAAFKAAGATRAIVDLRYNGGGLVSTAVTLASLAHASGAGQEMFRFDFNDHHPEEDSPVAFRSDPSAIDATRIAFITTHGSASASELVPNALEAYLGSNVALVGGATYGKPVGQVPWPLEACDLAFYLVSFRLANAQGDADYFAGLPDEQGHFTGPLCPAADDLSHPFGDPTEASVAAALHWLDTGECPAPAPAALSVSPRRVRPGAARFPAEEQPSFVQRWIPGAY